MSFKILLHFQGLFTIKIYKILSIFPSSTLIYVFCIIYTNQPVICTKHFQAVSISKKKISERKKKHSENFFNRTSVNIYCERSFNKFLAHSLSADRAMSVQCFGPRSASTSTCSPTSCRCRTMDSRD